MRRAKNRSDEKIGTVSRGSLGLSGIVVICG
jgi:hypothetical protein